MREKIMRVSVECLDKDTCNKTAVEENFLRAFFEHKPLLGKAYTDEILKIIFNYVTDLHIQSNA